MFHLGIREGLGYHDHADGRNADGDQYISHSDADYQRLEFPGMRVSVGSYSSEAGGRWLRRYSCHTSGVPGHSTSPLRQTLCLALHRFAREADLAAVGSRTDECALVNYGQGKREVSALADLLRPGGELHYLVGAPLHRDRKRLGAAARIASAPGSYLPPFTGKVRYHDAALARGLGVTVDARVPLAVIHIRVCAK
jgi:hypothetical protein